MNKVFDYIRLSKVEQKAVFLIFIVATFALSSLLIANVLYSDDFTRVTTGETFWNDNGRPLSSLVSILLQLGQPITDISPLPQILAFAIYALSAVYLGKLFQIDNFLLLTLCGIIFVLNPFNLQNFTFVFDSFPMALAVLTSVLAAFVISISFNLSLKKVEYIYSIGFGILLIFSSLSLYQAATSVYIVACVFVALMELLNRSFQRSLRYLFTSILTLIAGLILYLPVKNYYITNSYNLYHSETVSVAQAIPQIVNNILAFWRSVQTSLGNSNLILSLIYLIFLAALLTIFFKAINKLNLKFKIKTLLLIICLLFYSLLLIVSPLGMMLILKNPIFAPRTMMGFSTIVAICCFFLAEQTLIFKQRQKTKYWLSAFFCVVILAFSNVSFTLGNVLYSQNIQDEIIATVLISDLGEIVPQLPISLQHPTLAVVNSLDYTYGNTKAYSKYPLLKEITWFYLKTNQIQFYTKLETLGFKFTRPHYEKHVYTSANNQFIPTKKPVVTRPLYNIYFENDDLLVVVLHNPENHTNSTY